MKDRRGVDVEGVTRDALRLCCGSAISAANAAVTHGSQLAGLQERHAYSEHYEARWRELLAFSEKQVARLTSELEEAVAAKYPGCKVLSLGDDCQCKLCTLERERDRLHRVIDLERQSRQQHEDELKSRIKLLRDLLAWAMGAVPQSVATYINHMLISQEYK